MSKLLTFCYGPNWLIGYYLIKGSQNWSRHQKRPFFIFVHDGSVSISNWWHCSFLICVTFQSRVCQQYHSTICWYWDCYFSQLLLIKSNPSAHPLINFSFVTLQQVQFSHPIFVSLCSKSIIRIFVTFQLFITTILFVFIITKFFILSIRNLRAICLLTIKLLRISLYLIFMVFYCIHFNRLHLFLTWILYPKSLRFFIPSYRSRLTNLHYLRFLFIQLRNQNFTQCNDLSFSVFI